MTKNRRNKPSFQNQRDPLCLFYFISLKSIQEDKLKVFISIYLIPRLIQQFSNFHR